MSQASNIISVPTSRRGHAKPTRRPRGASKAALLRRQAPAAGMGLVILVLLYLSLNHLARGIAVVALCQDWRGRPWRSGSIS